LVPFSITGWPAEITVLPHDTIETKGLRKEDVPAPRERRVGA
jgi:hypothetical protein